MNKGENSAMPTQEPVFSTTDNNQTFQPQPPQMTTISSDPTANAGAAAFNSGVFSSNPGETPQPSVAQPRQMFNSRSYTPVEQKAYDWTTMPQQDTTKHAHDKKKIIALAVIIIACIAVGVAAVFTTTKTVEMIGANELKGAWNRFANYVLSGEAKDDAVSVNNDVSSVAKMLDFMYSDNGIGNDAIYEEATKSIDAVIDKNNGKSVSSNELSSIKEELALMQHIAKMGPTPSANKIAVCYVLTGVESCDAEISDHYNRDYGEQNDSMQRIAQAQLDRIAYEKQAAAAYITNGCVSSDGTVKTQCTATVDSKNLANLADDYVTAKELAGNSINMTVKGFLTDIKNINSEINK